MLKDVYYPLKLWTEKILYRAKKKKEKLCDQNTSYFQQLYF